MGYFQFSIQLRSGANYQFIRHLEDQSDIDRVWRIYEKKAKVHYKSQLASFNVIQLSKLSEPVKGFIKDQGKKDEMPDGDLMAKPTNRKKNRSQGMNLEDRNNPSF